MTTSRDMIIAEGCSDEGRPGKLKETLTMATARDPGIRLADEGDQKRLPLGVLCVRGGAAVRPGHAASRHAGPAACAGRQPASVCTPGLFAQPHQGPAGPGAGGRARAPAAADGAAAAG